MKDDAEEAASAKRAAQRAASAAEKAMRAAQMASAAAAETAACNSRSKRTAPKRAPPRQQRGELHTAPMALMMALQNSIEQIATSVQIYAIVSLSRGWMECSASCAAICW